ncbi:MAG: hypothetical protein QN208_02900, partial [Armatimonadota bacterium]|nr:hypothetical protein [Armatimonadota bacterium]
NAGALDAEFSQALLGRSWWAGIQHGLALLGLLAPLSAVRRWGRLLIAATHHQSVPRPHGSHPELDSRVRWAEVNVVHDSNDLSRYEKIQKVLKPYFDPKPGKPALRVCLAEDPGPFLNCGRCEKCVRTIVALLLAGMDPRAYGFPYHLNALRRARDRLLQGRYKITVGHLPHWQNLQRQVPESPPYPEPADFFAWLRRADFSEIQRISERRRKAEREALRRSSISKFVFASKALARRTLRTLQGAVLQLLSPDQRP